MTDDELATALRAQMTADSFKYDEERIKDVIKICRAVIADEPAQASGQ